MFAVNDTCKGQVLKFLSADLLNRYGLIHKFKVFKNYVNFNQLIKICKWEALKATQKRSIIEFEIIYLNNILNISFDLFNRLIYFQIPSSNLERFLVQIEQGYIKYSNPYHNNLHAADVTQTVHYTLWVTGLAVSPFMLHFITPYVRAYRR